MKWKLAARNGLQRTKRKPILAGETGPKIPRACRADIQPEWQAIEFRSGGCKGRATIEKPKKTGVSPSGSLKIADPRPRLANLTDRKKQPQISACSVGLAKIGVEGQNIPAENTGEVLRWVMS